LILILQIPDGLQGQVMAVAILSAELKSNIQERGEGGGRSKVPKTGLISDFESNILYVSSNTTLFTMWIKDFLWIKPTNLFLHEPINVLIKPCEEGNF
jgi:hypothetical protein